MRNKKNLIICLFMLILCLVLCTACASGVGQTLKNPVNNNRSEHNELGIGVADVIAPPKDNNTFEMGEPLINDEFDGSQIEYMVLEADAYKDISESAYSYDDMPPGAKEYYTNDKTLTEGKEFLLVKINARALTETGTDSPFEKNVHILSMHIFNDDFMREDVIVFDLEEKEGITQYKKSEKQYLYFSLPEKQEINFYIGFFVPEVDVEENLLLGVGSAVEDYQYISLKIN